MVAAAAYLLLAAPLAFLVLTRRFFSPLPPAIALQVAGLLVVVWARATFGIRSFRVRSTATPGGLVTTGPYRFVRHPIYSGVLLILGGVLVGHHDVATLIPVACVALALVARIAGEERAVLRMYPEYAGYAQRTNRLVPRLRSSRPPGAPPAAAPQGPGK